MTEWKEYKLGEIATFSQGVQVDVNLQSYVKEDEYIRFVRIVDYTKMGEELPRYIKNPGDKYLVSEFDLVMIRYGSQTAGKVVKGICGAIANNMFKIDLNSSIADNVYVYYWLSQNSVQDYFMQSQASSTMPAITFDMIGKLEISLPPLPEQKRIASILSSLDDKIDLLHRENATLERMAETLFRQWFVVEAKEEWEEKELREIVDISIGRTPPRKETKWFSTNPSDVKWLSIKDMGAGDVFLFNTSEYLTKEAVETFSIPIIPKDTVVLSFKMTVGRVGITTEDMLSNEAIAHFKFTNKTPITKEYLYLFLKSFKYDSLGSTSSIVTAINSAMIKQMQIIIPDEMIMKKFEEQTQYIFDKIYSNQKQIQTLIQQRDSLLPKLMSGEVKI